VYLKNQTDEKIETQSRLNLENTTMTESLEIDLPSIGEVVPIFRQLLSQDFSQLPICPDS
jgi:hypothetical protein